MMPIGAETFSEALSMTTETNIILRDILVKKYGKLAVNVGDEGGCAPPTRNIREALDLLSEAVNKAGYENKVVYALDVAATHLYDKSTQKYMIEGRQLSREELIELYKDLVASYPLVSIEDPLQEDDFEGFAELTKELPDVQIVGDDSVVVSERSGDTEDDIIADLVVGLNAGQIKTGAPVRSERTSKYNRLLQIEEELGSAAKYAGKNFRQPL